jgi:hypothetical protein
MLAEYPVVEEAAMQADADRHFAMLDALIQLGAE